MQDIENKVLRGKFGSAREEMQRERGGGIHNEEPDKPTVKPILLNSSYLQAGGWNV